MRFRSIMLSVVLLSSVAATSAADIYMWTDSNGVKHITNNAPPAHAEIIIRTPEIPYDAEADRRRHESDRQQQLARERQALAEREAQLLERERAANARIAQATQLARDAQEYQRQLASEARYDEDRYHFYGYTPYRHFPRKYYRKDGNIYYHNPERFRHLERGNHRGTHRLGPNRGDHSGSVRHKYQTNARRVPHPSGRSFY